MEKDQEQKEPMELSEESVELQDAPAPETVPEEAPTRPAKEEKSPAQRLAEHIKKCSIDSKVVPLKQVKLTPPEGVTGEEVAALLAAVGTPEADPALEKIAFVQGAKDRYFFETDMMTRHFAELQSLLEDKDILRTIATIARSDSQLYPRPTQFKKLMAYPFYFSMDEILGAQARMKMEEQYADIDVVTATNGGKGFYSSKYLSRRYAQALIQQVEVEEKENP
jgi:hypothetical protein